jgi:hypothetical protein
MCLNSLFNSLEKAIVATFDSKKELEKIARNSLNLNLETVVNLDQSLNNIIFDFVKYLDTFELIKKFIRNSVHYCNHESFLQFIANNIDFLLTYQQFNLDPARILYCKNNLSTLSNFDLVINAFDEVLNQLKYSQKVALPDSIHTELKYIRSDKISREVKLFILLEILISDYPFFAENNEPTLDKLDFYLNSYLKRDINANPISIQQKPYLQIIVQPSALPGQVILFAYLSFEIIHNDKQSELLDIIPIKYEQSSEKVEKSPIRFIKEEVMREILKFIETSNKEIDRRQREGYQINSDLMIEFFLPFDYLFKKIDRWTSPYGIGLKTPLCDNNRIIFRSYERLLKPAYRVSLRMRCLPKRTRNSFSCILKKIEPKLRISNDETGFVCFLNKTSSFRRNIVSVALENGIPIVVWFEPTHKAFGDLCDPNGYRCNNYSSLEGDLEFQQCILKRLIRASEKHSPHDL